MSSLHSMLVTLHLDSSKLHYIVLLTIGNDAETMTDYCVISQLLSHVKLVV